MGFLTKLLGAGFARNALGKYGVNQVRHMDRWVLGFHTLGAVAPFLIHKNEPRNERVKNIVQDEALNALMFGYVTASGQWAVNALYMAGSLSGTLGKAVNMAVRDGLAQRTSMSIPFSHTSAASQQSYASLQYASASIGGAYSSLGNQAAMLHAKLLAR